MGNMFDTQAYLQRINYHGSTEPTSETLKALHYQHMLTVPFENLDISLGKSIVLNQDSFYQKIVHQHRGGFCYELNVLFAQLLKELGFQVTLLSARVAIPAGGYGADFAHLTLLVEVADYSWLVDVGFGDSFREPIGFGPVSEQVRNAYRLVAEEAGYWILLQRPKLEQRERALYLFTLEPKKLEDFKNLCLYQQTSPDSIFTKGRLCTKATEEGRITLQDKELTIITATDKQVYPVADDREFLALLTEHFAITLPS